MVEVQKEKWMLLSVVLVMSGCFTKRLLALYYSIRARGLNPDIFQPFTMTKASRNTKGVAKGCSPRPKRKNEWKD